LPLLRPLAPTIRLLIKKVYKNLLACATNLI
jgi:hypothetical protein